VGTPRIPSWFWEAMGAIGPDALRNDTAALEVRFRALPRHRLLAFFRQFMRACSHANPVNRSGFRSREGNLSEDAGDDFAAWVVCRGRAYWSSLDRDSFQRCLDEWREADGGSERPDYVAGRIFEERFVEEVFDLIK